MSERIMRTVLLFAEDADWLWKERQIIGEDKENMAKTFARLRQEFEELRELRMKERFEK